MDVHQMRKSVRLSEVMRRYCKKRRCCPGKPFATSVRSGFSRKIRNAPSETMRQTTVFDKTFGTNSRFRSSATLVEENSSLGLNSGKAFKHQGVSSETVITLRLKGMLPRSVLRHFPEKSGSDSRKIWKEIALHRGKEILTRSFFKIGP